MADQNLTLPHQPEPEITTAGTLPAVARYVLGEEIARGGMGAIHRATDTTFRREVAVKVLQEQFPAGSPLARRFVEEAHITGQLQHPGIPPVYDLGALPDGRPFLAMKLIQGHTLAHILESRDRERAELIGVFEAICQAVGYAHTHGIIHRDLKPANVMVGAFGEVQVMDWGLAKALASRAASAAGSNGDTRSLTRHGSPDSPVDDPDRTTDQSVDDSTDERTRTGQVLGTPAYMPPEQARGEAERVDCRSDVFGLGAILCAILTGKPPFVAARSEAARRMAAAADLTDAFARLDACGADAELVSLCKRCLSAEPAGRPANGGEVAALVAGYRAEVERRLRTAERERAAAEAKAIEQRKKRRVQLALAAVIGLLMAGGLGFAWWQDRQAGEKQVAEREQQFKDERLAAEQQSRDGRTADGVAGLLAQGEDALRSDDADKATIVFDAAVARMRDGGAEHLRDRLDRSQIDLVLLRHLDRIDMLLWTTVEGKQVTYDRLKEEWAKAFAQWGIVPGTTLPTEAAWRLHESPIQNHILTALDTWLVRGGPEALVVLLHKADPDPFRDIIRETVVAQKVVRLTALAYHPAALAQPSRFAAVLGGMKAVPVDRRKLILGVALQRRPGDFGLLMTRGGLNPINTLESAADREVWYRAAVALRPGSAAAHTGLGIALLDKGDVDGAHAAMKEAIRFDPKLPAAHNNRGVALQKSGDLDGAIAEYRAAIILDPKSASAHANLGAVLAANGDLDGAIAEYREAIRFDPKLASTHYNLGVALRAKGDLDGAIAAAGEAIRLDPKFALAYKSHGLYLLDKGDLDGAIADFREGIRLEPKNANAHNILGVTLSRKGDLEGAIMSFERAMELQPENAGFKRNLALARKQKAERDAKLPPVAPPPREVKRSPSG